MLTGLYKLTPLFPHDPEVKMNDLRSPAEVLNFDVIADSLPSEDGQGVGPDLHVPNPQLDYIPPKLVSLYITDTGAAGYGGHGRRTAAPHCACGCVGDVISTMKTSCFENSLLIGVSSSPTAGGHCPSYVYRLLTEYYSPEDLSY